MSRWVVGVAALAAALLRFPGFFWPPRPDESGFILVARAWAPEPHSMFGPYFVDRPPQLIALVGLLDDLGGVPALRVAGAVAAVVLVVAAAGCARVVAGGGAAAWVAVATAAVVSNTAVDSVATKGELLGLPLIMGSCWLALLAARGADDDRGSRGPLPLRRALVQAAAAGLLASAALGMKQNLVGGLVFGGVLLVGSALAGDLPRARAVRLGLAATAGALVPVLATVGWALAAGVRLQTLWYDVYGFRSDAFAVISTYSSEANDVRALVLLSYAFAAGMGLIIGGFVVHVVGEWRDLPALTVAIAAMIVVDVAALALGGSFWRAYLFTLVPATALCAAMLVRRGTKRGVAMRVVIVASVVSCVVSSALWVSVNVIGADRPVEARTGDALAAAAEPGDTLVVFGGRADIQYLSGLDSPYVHLWSLPMRTLDPDYAELRSVLDGPDAPTWFVEAAWLGSWSNPHAPELYASLAGRYREVTQVCGDGMRIWLRDDVERPTPEVPCPGSGGETGQEASTVAVTAAG